MYRVNQVEIRAQFATMMMTEDSIEESIESIETELEDDEQVLIQCSISEDTANVAKTGSSRRRQLGGVLAVALLVIGITMLTVSIIANRKHSSTTSASAVNDNDQKATTQKTIPPSVQPLVPTSFQPSPIHSSNPSNEPTSSVEPSLVQSDEPTVSSEPSMSRSPSFEPTGTSSFAPTESMTKTPTRKPIVATSKPSRPTTNKPTRKPTPKPTTLPAAPAPVQNLISQTTTFYVIGDVPYTDQQAVELMGQIKNLPKDAEFLVHVGDLRSAGSICRREEYSSVASTLRLSHVPVFVILGDNDWNDCPNPQEGLEHWNAEFLGFESRFWDHSFAISTQPGRQENFSFQHKGTLFIGLNLVGGTVLSMNEWIDRLSSQVNWTKTLIRSYVAEISPQTGRVVIFGHADPTIKHQRFFNPLRIFIKDELENSVPILYVNGDGHEWLYEPNFYGQSSFLRIMVQGLTVDPPLKVMVEADGSTKHTGVAFKYDRMK